MYDEGGVPSISLAMRRCLLAACQRLECEIATAPNMSKICIIYRHHGARQGVQCVWFHRVALIPDYKMFIIYIPIRAARYGEERQRIGGSHRHRQSSTLVSSPKEGQRIILTFPAHCQTQSRTTLNWRLEKGAFACVKRLKSRMES